MRNLIPISVLLITINISCNPVHTQSKENENNSYPDSSEAIEIIDTTGTTIATRFKPPQGFERISKDSASFASYLRSLPLKPTGFPVRLYDGTTKPNDNIYEAVVDLPIGKYDLHQCADAIMRLRAEYFWENKQYNQIHFNLTNGFRVDYKYWMQGKRVAVKGNKTWWVARKSPSNTYKDFWSYMEFVFTYAGTLSLSKELIPVKTDSMKIGDIFIFGGSPGHSIIVVDMAVNPKTEEKVFMVAQSYMPAQETQVLKNNENKKISPWYSTKFEDGLYTPECYFSENDLMRFKND